MYLVTFVVATIILLGFIYKLYRERNLPPGPYGLPLLGYLPFMDADTAKTLARLGSRYGSVMSINMAGMSPVVVLNDWKAVKEALIKQGEIFNGRQHTFSQTMLFQKSDVIYSEGVMWKKLRHFCLQTLRDFGIGRTSMEAVIMEEIEELTRHLNNQDAKSIDPTKLFFIPVLNIIWGISAGKHFETKDDDTKRFDDDFQAIGEVTFWNIIDMLPLTRHVRPWKTGYTKFCQSLNRLLSYMQREIDDHVRNFNDNKLDDFIDVFLAEIKKRKMINVDETEPFDQKHLVFTLLDFFMVGVETTEVTLSWAILYMASFPEIQQKVQQELDKVVSADSFLSLSSKSLIPYTEATLMEVERMASIVPIPPTHRTTRDTKLLGYDIPKDTHVLVNLYSVHHNKHDWKDPETFRPERFLTNDGRKVKRHDCFIPFGAGPRQCVGEQLGRLELFLFFTCLMRRFSFHLIPGDERFKANLEPAAPSLLLRPQPFSAIVKRRE